MNATAALQFFFSGLTNGAIYAFVALGIAVTFASSGVVNFAQGQFVMLGGVVAVIVNAAGLPVLAAMVGGVLAAMIAGYVMGRVFILYMLPSGEFAVILVTLALSITIEAFAVVVLGPDPLTMPSLFDVDPIMVGTASITIDSVVILCAIVVTLGVFSIFLAKTRWGRAMRATSVDRTVASSLGINVGSVITSAFVLSGFFGSLAGILLTSLISTGPQVGFAMTLKGITAAALGGMASPVVAVLGGLLLGLVEAAATGYISSVYQNVISFSLLLFVLWLRPQGLLTVQARQL
jgi:branched-chain amino acid transport system permease protein